MMWKDKEIAVLESVINKARKSARNPIRRTWNKMLSRFYGRESYNLSREECIKPLYRELTTRMEIIKGEIYDARREVDKSL